MLALSWFRICGFLAQDLRQPVGIGQHVGVELKATQQGIEKWSGSKNRLEISQHLFGGYQTLALYMAVVQNSLSGIWPTLAKKCNPFASSFAKLSRSPFSHVGQLGVPTWIPTFERPNWIFGPSYGCYPKLLHNRMTSSRKSKFPFANTIARFRENMFQALNP